MRLKTKLIVGSILLAVIPVVIASGLISQQVLKESYRILQKQGESRLLLTREVKKSQIEAYFHTVRDQALTFSNDRMVIEAMHALKPAFQAFRTEVVPDSRNPENWKSQLARYYTEDFSQEYTRRNPGQASPAQSLFSQLDQDSIALQYHYIQANPYPLGRKDELNFSDDGSSYSRLHDQYHSQFQDFQERFGYYDIFLVDPDSGDIVYSVFKELDYATSLIDGPYADTGIGRVFQDANKAHSADAVVLDDLAPYSPSYEESAFFIASPIFDDGQKIGILILQMPMGPISRIMTNRGTWEQVGLGQSGETYLIGPDLTMRSQSRFLVENPSNYLQAIQAIGLPQQTIDRITDKNITVGLQPVNTVGARAALAGESGFQIFPDYRGVPVFSAYAPLDVPGLHWAIMSEIDEAEAVAPQYVLKKKIIFTTMGIVGIILLGSVSFGWFFAISTIKPIATLNATIDDIVCGGRMTKRAKVASRDEIGRLAQSYNSLLDRLQNMNQQMEEASVGVTGLAQNVMRLVGPMGVTIRDQFSQATMASSATEEMAVTVQEVSRNAQEASLLAKKADEEATKGGEAVSQTTAGMSRLADLVAESAQKVKALGQRSDQIGHITELIDEIADQTNLLALNAAIEAARAGEQGRGFAVVADEVRKLAERTSKATKEITGMIQAMQGETKTAVAVMERGTQEVGAAVNLANQSGDTLSRIVESVGQVTDSMTQIATATQEQTIATTEISGNIVRLAGASEENEAKITTISDEVIHLIGYAYALQWMTASESDDLSSEPESSFARVSLDPGFIEQFYDFFLQSHPSIEPMFAHVDMVKQRQVLRSGIAMLLLFARGDEMSKMILDRVIEKHKLLNLSPDLFQYWEESLLKALRGFDGNWNPELERIWRKTLSKGIAYLS